MTDTTLTTRLFFDWHGAAQWIACGLLASLLVFAILQYIRARRAVRGLGGDSLGTAIGLGAVLLGLVPTIALVVLLSERSAHLRHERMESRIEEMAAAVSHSIERFVDKHVAGISAAASSVNASGDFAGPSVEHALLRHHRIYGDFLTMLGTDQDGNIVAASSRISGQLAPFRDLQGLSVADREYFTAPMANGFPFVSQAFRGRGFGADPIVAISAPLRNQSGKRVGVVEGSLNLRAFDEVDQEHPHIDAANIIVVDGKDQVVYSSQDAEFEFLEELQAHPLVVAAQGVRQKTSFDFGDRTRGKERDFMAAFATTSLGWRVFVRIPTDPIAQQMIGDYKVGLMLLLVTAIISLMVASALTHRVRRALHDLNNAVRSFTVNDSDGPVSIPEHTPLEFTPVFEHMRTRSTELRGAYRRLNQSIEAGDKLRKELTQAIALRDVEIAERTAELEKANKELSSQSKRDPLTKIANRREFEGFEQRIWKLGAREDIPVAVIFVDIDYFKAYNDKLGHQAGDACLKLVARALAGCANRPLDLVARYGGEEFVAVLGGAAVADALIVAENMRRSIRDLGMVHPSSEDGIVTVSVGAASMIPTRDHSAETLIKAADEALYHAKKAGRDRVVFRRDGDFVTYDPLEHGLDSTNIIRMLAGDRHRKAKGPGRG